MASAMSEKTLNASSMLRPAVRTTVVKTNTLGHVLPEPVKCAVVRQGLADAGHAATSLMTSGRKAERHSVNKHTINMEQCKQNAAAMSLPVGTVIPMPCVVSNQATAPTSRIPSKHCGLMDGKPVLIAVKPHATDSVKRTCEVDGTGINISSDVVAGSVVCSSHEATVPATLDRHGGLDRLESEVSILKDQLEVQLKVNADLKKLLVASIGDDLHHKVESLVRTKIQLASEIDDYAKKLVEDYEDLDKMSIQADIWHSKFKASRVLVDQLNADRSRLSSSFCEAQTALQTVLTERRELHHLLQQCQRYLETVRTAVKPTSSDSASKLPSDGFHTLALAGRVEQLAYEIYVATQHTIPPQTTDASIELLTPGEQLAHEVLVGGSHSLSTRFSSPYFGRVQSFPLLKQLHPHARFEGVTFNCCAHCKGEIRLV